MPLARAPYVVLALLALVGSGCHSTPPEALARMRASCILVVLDAASATHFGTYGYARATTPVIDALAAEGIVFEQARSQGVSTIISVPSFFSGLYPQTITRRRAADAGYHPWFVAQAFQAAGFRTAAFSESPFVSADFATNVGFEHFVERPASDGSRALVGDALDWLAAHRSDRFFLYLHLVRPHNPYIPPEDIARRFRPASYQGSLVPDTNTLLAIDQGLRPLGPGDLDFLVSQYDANLFYGDSLVGELRRQLADQGLLARTAVVVTADHGEAFGQHTRFLHNSTLYEEMLHVPLIFRLPPRAGIPPRRIATPVALLDLFPTLAELFSLGAPPGGFEGTSLVPLMEHPEAPWPARLTFAQSASLVAAFDADWKYIVRPAPAGGNAPLREEL